MLTPVLITDKQTRVVYANKEFLRFSGAKKRNVNRHLNADKFIRFAKDVWEQITKNTQRVRLVDVYGKTTDTQNLDLWANILSIPILGHENKIAGNFLIFQDKTVEVTLHNHYKKLLDVQKDQLEKLQQSYEQLQEMDRIKSNLLAVVSHEMRTPLAVQGYTLEAFKDYIPLLETFMEKIHKQLTDNDLESPELKKTKKIIEKISKGATRLDSNLEKLNQLVDNILDLRQLTMGKMKLNYQKFNISNFLKGIDHNFQVMVGKTKTNQTLVIVFDKAFEYVTADPIRLEQVFVNIIGNGLRYNRENGNMTINLDYDDSYYRFSISDEGIGIPEEEREKIFSSFYSIGSVDKHTRKSGTLGLGLTISKSIIESHGGQIMVGDNPDWDETRGTRFTFTISKSQDDFKKQNP